MLSFLKKIIKFFAFFYRFKILREKDYDTVIFDIESKYDFDYLLKERKFFINDRNKH